MSIIENYELSPREHLIMEHDAEEARLKREHAVRIKELDLALAREKYQAEIELRRLEAKWSSWLRLPATIIKLPIYVLFGIGFIVSVFKKTEPSKNFWSYLK